MTLCKNKCKGIRFTDVGYKLQFAAGEATHVHLDPAMPTHVCPSSSKLTMTTTTSTCFIPAWTNNNAFLSALDCAWLFLLKRTITVCSKHEAESNFKELILKKTKQQQSAIQKRCVNFILWLKSWVNYMCLSSNGAKQFFVSLASPGVLAHMPAWSASLVTRVRTLPASLGHKVVCACGSVCVCMSVCASICYNWGGSCDRSPLTPTLCERMHECVARSGYTLQM